MNDFIKDNWFYIQNILSLLVCGALFLMVRGLAKREYWRLAFRQVFRRWAVRVSFVIICLYALIALLDSIGYHPALRDENGNVRRDVENRVLTSRDGLSVLDLMLTPLRKSRETSYSAPFATHRLDKTTLVDPETATIRRDHEPLKHPGKHILGTDKTGQDVLYLAFKGIRTGMLIGAFTTLLVIPFAILFGITAGYFGKWIDDIIQYIYTVLSSIPSVLVIAAFMLAFGRGLTQLCIVMGITAWTGLCRVLRGETMKQKEMEYVQAAKAMGISDWKIMFSHILPNVMHVALIAAVLSFSGRVLAESVLSYLGIGVGPDTISWGVMINEARQELAREPVVWWKLGAAFIFMLGLVLPANLFGDALRDALDPRLKQ